MESKVREAIGSVGRGKAPRIDGLPYKLFSRLSHVFVPLLTAIYNNWWRQEGIPSGFTRGVIKLFRKSKDGGNGLGNFCPLTMLTAELKILAKVLSVRLQGVLDRLIDPDQTCAVKGEVYSR